MAQDTIAHLITTQLGQGANNIFLREGEKPRVRVSGDVLVTQEAVTTWEDLVELGQLCELDLTQQAEGDARCEIAGVNFRVNFFRANGQQTAAIRPIWTEVPSMDELGLPSSVLQGWLQNKSGLILVSGPTGAGKSTTVASCLEHLNQTTRQHILTVEDPVEYLFTNRHSYFSQREIGPDAVDYREALKSSLRQNPDVIMAGEVSDEETAQFVLRASETGHLILSTLHAPGVVETMRRLMLLFPPDRREGWQHLFANQLLGILSQRLLTGPDGKLQVVCEYIRNKGAVRKWVESGNFAEIQDFLNRPDGEGNKAMLTGLVEAAQEGKVSREAARAAAPNEQDFDRLYLGIS